MDREGKLSGFPYSRPGLSHIHRTISHPAGLGAARQASSVPGASPGEGAGVPLGLLQSPVRVGCAGSQRTHHSIPDITSIDMGVTVQGVSRVSPSKSLRHPQPLQEWRERGRSSGPRPPGAQPDPKDRTELRLSCATAPPGLLLKHGVRLSPTWDGVRSPLTPHYKKGVTLGSRPQLTLLGHWPRDLTWGLPWERGQPPPPSPPQMQEAQSLVRVQQAPPSCWTRGPDMTGCRSRPHPGRLSQATSLFLGKNGQWGGPWGTQGPSPAWWTRRSKRALRSLAMPHGSPIAPLGKGPIQTIFRLLRLRGTGPGRRWAGRRVCEVTDTQEHPCGRGCDPALATGVWGRADRSARAPVSNRVGPGRTPISSSLQVSPPNPRPRSYQRKGPPTQPGPPPWAACGQAPAWVASSAL